MKTAALILFAAILAPALAIISRGAEHESWRIITAGAALVAIALGGIHYLIN